ncbi:HD domain-containing protein [Pontibacter sp. H249]|uniref:HD domain-containing protein n=1 Tax=Pontibacter sp. H249 TaxID=3133420 RepID=UPI0030C5F7C6
MSIELITKAEQKAKQAENLEAFKSVNLAHIKSKVAQILGLIGKNGVFGEYTKHDISHINKVLKLLDWLIPEETANSMTSGDWLMIVLAIYFHDLGMLVTEDEFNNRINSDFPKFKNDILNNTSNSDFTNKVNALEKNKAERFLYQEFVRSKHAERIKNWITAKSTDNLGVCEPIVKEIIELLKPLDDKLKKDLAMICESHHLNDLDDFNKYKVVYRYGSDEQEAVNLHYCALILRTADLLHITSDRTPSTEFRLINPSDPKSQEEWYKQMAVTAVSPKPKQDKDGKIDRSIQSDTVEVTAYFKEENGAIGFFGLIAYLNFARKELLQNHKWAQEAQIKHGSKFNFPWKDIDDSSIETEGFEKKLFEFKLDQSRILQLLVGHTLYNDSTVVLRELIQNAIDAVRLQNHIDKIKNINAPIGEVKIDWIPQERILSFTDNGTGMSQEIIENHLLKVGSSRYQSDSFKKNYPDFSPISRFGIGILTCFLIADNVDILTSHQDEDTIKKLSIRKVDGKYLLQHIDKSEVENFIRDHGTRIQIEVRHDVNMDDIENQINKWILFPSCEVSLTVNNSNRKRIGYSSPKAAIEKLLGDYGYEVDNKNIKVEEQNFDGVQLAYALKYSKSFNEWTFLNAPRYHHKHNSYSQIGTCVEGVRVEFNPPGYKRSSLISVANVTGKHAPKTNVARSNIEANSGKENLLKNIYNLYIDHIVNEVNGIQERGGFSLTWAINESSILLAPLINNKAISDDTSEALDESLFFSSLENAPLLLIEENLNRRVASVNEINGIENIWTTDCNLFRSAESLIREIQSSSSLTELMKTLYSSDNYNMSHINTLFCGFNPSDILHKYALRNRQITTIKVFPFERRVDICWSVVQNKNNWAVYSLHDTDARYNHNFNTITDIYIQVHDCVIEGIKDEVIIKCLNSLIFLKGSPINNFLVSFFDENPEDTEERHEVVQRLLSILKHLIYYNPSMDFYNPSSDFEKWIEQLVQSDSERFGREIVSDEIFWKFVNKPALINSIMETKWKIFDSSAWSRKLLTHW